MQIIAPAKVYPVIVIGSGASGGMAAWNLTAAGHRRAAPRRGREVRPRELLDARPALGGARAARARRAPRAVLPRHEGAALPHARRTGRSSSSASGATAARRTSGAASACAIRDLDFKAAERDGWEIPWPIPTPTSRPTTTRSSSSSASAAATTTRRRCRAASSSSRRRRPAAASVFCRGAETKLGIPIVAGRRANMTRPTARLPRLPLLRQLRRGLRHRLLLLLGRPPAAVRAEDRQARDPLERGRRAHARRTTRASRPACSTSTGTPAASSRCAARSSWSAPAASTPPAFSSTRSRSVTPTASATARDVIGRYLCEQIRINVAGFLPALVRHAHAERPRHRRRAHLHAALQPSPGRRRDYLRGFGTQFWNTGAQHRRRAWRFSARARLRRVAQARDQAPVPGLGRDPSVRRGPAVRAQPHHGRSTRVDRYGVPLPSIDYRIGENERKMAEHMADTVEEIVKAVRRRARELQARRSSTPWAPPSTSTGPAAWAPTRSARR